MTNLSLQFQLYRAQNNANPQLNGSIGASDVVFALKAGHGARLPAILTGSASSTGSGRILNDTGDLAGLAVGDWIHNITDGSWAIVTVAGTDSVETTPLRGGSDNTWSSGDTWARGRFVATLVALDPTTGDITKSERVLVTNHAGTADSVTVTRSFDSDTALTFSADDYLMMFVLEEHIEESKKALAQSFVSMDELRRGQHNYAADTGSANAYVVTLDPPVTSMAMILGMPIRFKAANANTATSTLNVNGIGAQTIRKEGGNAILVANDILANMMVEVVWNGTYFLMQTPSALPPASGDMTVLNKTEDYTILTADSSKVFTGGVKYTLPSASAGLNFKIMIAGSGVLALEPASGDVVNVRGTLTDSTHLQVYTPTAYAEIELIAIDSTNWMAHGAYGTWYRTAVHTKGYWAGGNTGAYQSLIDDLVFAADTSAQLAAALDTARGLPTGVSGWDKGYFMGGDNAGAQNKIDDMNYTSEASAQIAATLDTAKYGGAGVQTIDRGYILGGYTTGYTNVIENMVFIDDTSAAVAATITTAKGLMTGGISSSSKGYTMGGSTGTRQTEISYLTFLSQATAALAATLDTAKDYVACGYNMTKGYGLGGNTGSASTGIEDLIFSNETSSVIVTVLGIASSTGCAVCDKSTKIWITSHTSSGAAIEKFVISGETISTLAATLNTGRGQSGGVY